MQLVTNVSVNQTLLGQMLKQLNHFVNVTQTTLMRIMFAREIAKL